MQRCTKSGFEAGFLGPKSEVWLKSDFKFKLIYSSGFHQKSDFQSKDQARAWNLACTSEPMALKPKFNFRPLVNRQKPVSSSIQVPSKRLISKKRSLNWNSIQFSTRLMLLLCSRFQCPQKIISCLKAMFCSSPCILEVIVLRLSRSRNWWKRS